MSARKKNVSARKNSASMPGRKKVSLPGNTKKNGAEALAAESETPFSVTPLLGALLRVTHEALTLGIIEAVGRQGIEMTETEFSVMRYPGPHGLRPIDLARRCNMTKQAMNYVLAGFESKGYIERRSPPGQRSTTIYLTPKGWKLLSATRQCATEIEAQWAAHIGAERFDAVRASLYEIAVWLGKLPDPQPAPALEKATTAEAFLVDVEGPPISAGTKQKS
ncbi:MAG: MarR family winged helix-turn-helix transcriptional regulator [Pseudorhodoplanes sp.]|uniref:MarR family winged helix-turn-helix transcriptional regulator n=1 Tax=Pseudorhodoplanes sp. TaxID=1934341 RepID=UPI003D099757